MLESAITRRIVANLKKYPESFVEKRHGSGFSTRGIPDVEFIWRGKVYFFEVKQPGKQPSKIQRHMIDVLRNAGATVEVVHSWEDVYLVVGDK